MTRSMFGWSLPPGCTHQHIDDAYGHERPCETCGIDAADCICPECPVCHESGNPYCYDEGHLTYTTSQLIGRSKMRIAQLQQQLADEGEALYLLQEQLDKENS